MHQMTELFWVRIETNRADPNVEAYVRAETMLGFFYPAGLVGRGIARMGEQRGLQLKDGSVIFGGKSESGNIFFRVFRDGTDVVQFSVNNDGLRALNIADTPGYKKSYITRTMFAGAETFDLGLDGKFKELAQNVVNWLGASIFLDKLQPIPEETTSSLRQITKALK